MSNENEIKSKKPLWKKLWVWVIGIFLLIIIASGCGGEPTAENKQRAQSITKIEKTQPIEKTKEETEKKSQEEKRQKEINDYFLKITDISQTNGKALAELGDFLQTKPLLLLWTDEEILKVVAKIVTIQMSYKDTEKLQPPKEMEEIHTTFLERMKYYNDAMDNLIKGIDDLDVDSINEAANKMEKGTELTEETARLIEEFRKEKL